MAPLSHETCNGRGACAPGPECVCNASAAAGPACAAVCGAGCAQDALCVCALARARPRSVRQQLHRGRAAAVDARGVPRQLGAHCELPCPTAGELTCNGDGACFKDVPSGTAACRCFGQTVGRACNCTDATCNAPFGSCRRDGVVLAGENECACTSNFDPASRCRACLPNWYGPTCDALCYSGAEEQYRTCYFERAFCNTNDGTCNNCPYGFNSTARLYALPAVNVTLCPGSQPCAETITNDTLGVLLFSQATLVFQGTNVTVYPDETLPRVDANTSVVAVPFVARRAARRRRFLPGVQPRRRVRRRRVVLQHVLHGGYVLERWLGTPAGACDCFDDLALTATSNVSAVQPQARCASAAGARSRLQTTGTPCCATAVSTGALVPSRASWSARRRRARARALRTARRGWTATTRSPTTRSACAQPPALNLGSATRCRRCRRRLRTVPCWRTRAACA